MSKILPCPFCNKQPYEGRNKNGGFVIRCFDCPIIMDHDRRDKVVGHWNRREFCK